MGACAEGENSTAVQDSIAASRRRLALAFALLFAGMIVCAVSARAQAERIARAACYC